MQLIGVMTQEMPLAVVLEYLEHGSLRALLLDTKDHHRCSIPSEFTLHHFPIVYKINNGEDWNKLKNMSDD